MLQSEYFVIERENKGYPLFSWDQSSGQFGLGRPVQFNEPVSLRIKEPVPPEPELVDFHELPEPVFSHRVGQILAPLDIYGIQLVPAKVRNPNDRQPVFHDYCFMHIWNRISCLDKDNSELELYDDGSIFGIEKLVLNERTLGAFELPKRLIFQLAEKTPVSIIHLSVKDALMAARPVGVRFIPVKEWYTDIAFD